MDYSAEPRPCVAIIVVGYNSSDVIGACLESVENLLYTNIRPIFVDNASSDDSIERVKAQHPSVEIIETGFNAGYCGGNNVGLRRAADLGCEYALIMNPDTVVVNRAFLTKLVEYMDRRADVGRVGPRVLADSNGRVQNTIGTFPSLWRRWGFRLLRPVIGDRDARSANVEEAFTCDSLNGCCVLVRLRAVLETGGMDAVMWGYVDEVDWDYRMKALGWQRAFVPVTAVVHASGGAPYSLTSMQALMQARNMAYYFRKHGMWVQCYLWVAVKICVAFARMFASLVTRHGVKGHAKFCGQLWACLWAVIFGKFGSRKYGFGSEAYCRGWGGA